MACLTRLRAFKSLLPSSHGRILQAACSRMFSASSRDNQADSTISIQTTVERDMPIPTERRPAGKRRRKRKMQIMIRTPIEYDYTYVRSKKSKIRVKLQDLENKPEKREEFIDHENVQRLINEQQMDQWMKLDNGDMPVEGLPNPYAKAPSKCVLCQLKIDLDYKNTRLLSQFVSPFTGQIMGRHITGLCVYMQHSVRNMIKRAQYFGYMPYHNKDPDYLKDPKLFDPFRRKW